MMVEILLINTLTCPENWYFDTTLRSCQPESQFYDVNCGSDGGHIYLDDDLFPTKGVEWNARKV